MSIKVFIPQEHIDRWVGADQVELSGEVLTFLGSPLSLRMTPGFFFARVSGDTGDGHGLLGRVKTSTEIAALGAEAYMSSVLLGETAYDVEAGFVACPMDPACTRRALVDAMIQAGG